MVLPEQFAAHDSWQRQQFDARTRTIFGQTMQNIATTAGFEGYIVAIAGAAQQAHRQIYPKSRAQDTPPTLPEYERMFLCLPLFDIALFPSDYPNTLRRVVSSISIALERTPSLAVHERAQSENRTIQGPGGQRVTSLAVVRGNCLPSKAEIVKLPAIAPYDTEFQRKFPRNMHGLGYLMLDFLRDQPNNWPLPFAVSAGFARFYHPQVEQPVAFEPLPIDGELMTSVIPKITTVTNLGNYL